MNPGCKQSQDAIDRKLSGSDARILERFLDALWAERGLSDSTLAAYRADLKGFALWLAGDRSGLIAARRDDLLDYLAERVKKSAYC
jgi:integrase/recombinase XerD